MAKTSIFSQKYDKRRKQKNFIKKLALLIFLLVIIFLIFRNPIMDKVNKVKQDITEEELVEKSELPDSAQTPETIVETPESEKKIFADFTLDQTNTLSLEMEDGEDGLIFKEPTMEEAFEFDRSPDHTQMVILDKTSQELYLAKANGELTNITYRVYKNSRGYTESKENILSRTKDFVWAEQPRFLDEDTVVYMSQLPWFDERKFLYIVELNPLSHRNFQSVFGTDLVLKELDEKGLAYEKAGKPFYFSREYKILTP